MPPSAVLTNDPIRLVRMVNTIERLHGWPSPCPPGPHPACPDGEPDCSGKVVRTFIRIAVNLPHHPGERDGVVRVYDGRALARMAPMSYSLNVPT